MLCGQTLGTVLWDVIGVRYRRGLWRLRRAVVNLMVVGRLDVHRRLPVVVQVPQGRRSHVMMRRRRHLLVGRHARLRFHHVAGKWSREVSEPAQNPVVHVTVDVLYHRNLVDLWKTIRWIGWKELQTQWNQTYDEKIQGKIAVHLERMVLKVWTNWKQKKKSWTTANLYSPIGISIFFKPNNR